MFNRVAECAGNTYRNRVDAIQRARCKVTAVSGGSGWE